MGRNLIRIQELYPDAVADEDIVLPGKKKKNPNPEWKLQAAVVKLCKQYERIYRDFWWMAPGALSVSVDPRRAAFAKMIGYRKGILDIWLINRLHPGARVEIVELKRPGGKLTPEQVSFMEWSPFPCHKCESLAEFSQVLIKFLEK